MGRRPEDILHADCHHRLLAAVVHGHPAAGADDDCRRRHPVELCGQPVAESGPQVWQVTNDGENLHNAVLVAGDVEADVSEGGAAVTEAMAEADIANGVGILSPGQVAYMLLDLEPDSYTLVDTLPEGEGGDTNAAQGMVAVVEVE